MNESCAQRYSHLFSENLKELFKEHDVPIPYILELIDEFCPDQSCSHHLFSVKIGHHQSNNPEAPIAKKCHGCACLLGLLTESAPLEEIGNVYSIDRQTVHVTEQKAFKKMKRRSSGLCLP